MANILLAEDDPVMNNFITLALERDGHNVTSNSNGIDALKNLSSEQKFDLLITDIVMPGMDGLELAKKAKNQQKNIKIMFITGFSTMEEKHCNEASKSRKLLSKPFHLNDLIKQVDNILKIQK